MKKVVNLVCLVFLVLAIAIAVCVQSFAKEQQSARVKNQADSMGLRIKISRFDHDLQKLQACRTLVNVLFS